MKRALPILVVLVAFNGFTQGVPPAPRSVSATIVLQDGGTQVLQVEGRGGDPVISHVTNRVDSNVSTAPGVNIVVAGDLGGGPIRAETTGAAGGPVITNATILGTPTFALPSSTLSLLAGQRNCSYTPLGNPRIDAGYPTPLPRAANQTGITIQAHNFGNQVDFVSCWPETFDAGPLPDCVAGGIGFAIHSGGAMDLDLTSAHRVHCISCAHGGGPGAQGADLAGGVTSCTP